MESQFEGVKLASKNCDNILSILIMGIEVVRFARKISDNILSIFIMGIEVVRLVREKMVITYLFHFYHRVRLKSTFMGLL